MRANHNLTGTLLSANQSSEEQLQRYNNQTLIARPAETRNDKFGIKHQSLKQRLKTRINSMGNAEYDGALNQQSNSEILSAFDQTISKALNKGAKSTRRKISMFKNNSTTN